MLAVAPGAAGHLVAAGSRASARGELPAAAGLLERELSLMPAVADGRAEAQTLLGATLMELGRLPEAETQLGQAEAAARAQNNRVAAISAQVTRAGVRLLLDPGGTDLDAVAGTVRGLIPEPEEAGADAALAAAWQALITLSMFKAGSRSAEEAAARAFDYARRAGHVLGAGQALSGGCSTCSTPRRRWTRGFAFATGRSRPARAHWQRRLHPSSPRHCTRSRATLPRRGGGGRRAFRIP
jgi:hypothetical protein